MVIVTSALGGTSEGIPHKSYRVSLILPIPYRGAAPTNGNTSLIEAGSTTTL
jgi:hypothetical protein